MVITNDNQIYLFIFIGIIIILSISTFNQILLKRKKYPDQIITENKNNEIDKKEKWERIITITSLYYNCDMIDQANQRILRNKYYDIKSLDQGIIETYNIFLGRGL